MDAWQGDDAFSGVQLLAGSCTLRQHVVGKFVLALRSTQMTEGVGMSHLCRFVRNAVLPLVVGAAALLGGYLAVDHGQAAPDSSAVAAVSVLDDISWG
ncbi:hypothetical protein [Streptomyces sp. CBMA156]|uniref:hypothetical protein n=1 Tax=Streptomyces sp. CBMA156 TaxID=1930280 RepID=UPI00166209BB|nr:hypothetical protein [Streptomyces sp. CBMA156]MBD0669549.1 hypothetical protein [Streptomyces sp. CBMA156]